MRRAAMFLGGLLAGFVAAAILPGSHLSATLGPAAISWDASSCPVGVYTITSTAIAFKGGGTLVTTSSGVQLPKQSFTQFFDNLPAGKYAVSAIARDADGNAFRSGTQLLTAGVLGAASLAVRQPSRPPLTRQSGARTGPGTRSTAAPEPPPVALSEGPAATPTGPPAIKLDQLADRFGDGSGYRRIDWVDLDDDGEVDVLRIEWSSGAVFVLRIVK